MTLLTIRCGSGDMKTTRLLTTCLAFLTFTVFHAVSQVHQNGLLYCTKDGEFLEARFVLFKHDDDVKRVVAHSAFPLFGPMDTECSNTGNMFITGDGTDDNPFVMYVRWTDNPPPVTPRLQIVSNSDCGMTSQAGTNVYLWYVETRVRESSASPVLLMGEYNYNLRCDFSDVAVLTAANGTSTITENESSGVDRSLNKTKDNVDFFVADEDGNAVSSVELGMKITLRVVLDNEGDGASGVYATRCRACSDSTCSSAGTEIYELSKASGCLEADLTGHIGPEDTPFFRAPSPPQKTSLAFGSFRFTGKGMDVVYFFCSIDYCFGNDTDRCTSDDMCTLPMRKRRSAENETREVHTHLIIRNEPKPVRQTYKKKDPVLCPTTIMYIALCVSLGVLLLLSLAIMMVVFVRVNRRLKQKRMSFA